MSAERKIFSRGENLFQDISNGFVKWKRFFFFSFFFKGFVSFGRDIIYYEILNGWHSGGT